MSDPDIIYGNLLKLYELTLDRRKTLTGQAAGLLSFTGVIQTVFLGLLITLATNTQARAALLEGPNHTTITYLLAIGFVTFMITIVLALIAYFEQKWVPAPKVLSCNDADSWRKELEDYEKNPDNIPVLGYKLQLMLGITDNNRINKQKYWVLFIAYCFLAASLFLLATVGFYFIAGIA